jgi:hypothetical protein
MGCLWQTRRNPSRLETDKGSDLVNAAAITLLIGLAMSGPALASDLPRVLHCEVTGSFGCGADFCTGAGIEDSSIHLTVDTKTKIIDINRIKGHIDDDKPVDVLADSPITWSHRVIAFDYVSAYRVGKRFWLNVGKQNESGLEFTCLK